MRVHRFVVYASLSLLFALGCTDRAVDPTPDASPAELDAGPTGGDADAGSSGETDGGSDGETDGGDVADDAGPLPDPDAGPIASDAGSDAGPVLACGQMGQLCNDDQPCSGDWRCYGFGGNGFCAPFAPECGGFADIRCGAGRTCIRGGGGDLGYCALADERTCICDRTAESGTTTDGCR